MKLRCTLELLQNQVPNSRDKSEDQKYMGNTSLARQLGQASAEGKAKP
jgi:hypothetical protein